jgi:hypothetical protein
MANELRTSLSPPPIQNRFRIGLLARFAKPLFDFQKWTK